MAQTPKSVNSTTPIIAIEIFAFREYLFFVFFPFLFGLMLFSISYSCPSALYTGCAACFVLSFFSREPEADRQSLNLFL